jgi:hypothetical protein
MTDQASTYDRGAERLRHFYTHEPVKGRVQRHQARALMPLAYATRRKCCGCSSHSRP